MFIISIIPPKEEARLHIAHSGTIFPFRSSTKVAKAFVRLHEAKEAETHFYQPLLEKEPQS
ncbi:MAG: hypothetical protein AAF206_28970 [Bacteroidota bacterium]